MAKIKCVSCGRVVAETTNKFNPDVRPNGAMIRLAEPYASRGWAKVIRWTEATMCSMIFCPQCEYPLAPSGRLNLVDAGQEDGKQASGKQTGQEVEGKEKPADGGEEVCPKCGKPATAFKNSSGFVNHCRMCRG